MNSSTTKGTKFENQVYDLISSLLNEDNFIAPKKFSKVYKKKKYYSPKREKDIIFDVTIETTLPDADKYSSLVIIECKNLSRKVTVDDVEEFGSKINQVGEHNTKGIIITTNSFQESAYKIAKNEGIGLIRINALKKFEWISYRKDKTYQGNKNRVKYLTDEKLINEPFVASINNQTFTNFADLLINISVIDRFVDNEEFIDIPYISHQRLNHIVKKLYTYNLYNGCVLDIEKLTSFLEPRYNISFEYDIQTDDYLGKIDFNPLSIKISDKAKENINRWRFTVAHEIGHLILHSKLLKDRLDKKVDDEVTLTLKYSNDRKNAEKVEIQANLFASYLLLPENLLIPEINRLFTEYRIHKGYLYLDSQPVNQKEVYEILKIISYKFQVSIEAIKLRLIQLNLLQDKTDYKIGTLMREYLK